MAAQLLLERRGPVAILRISNPGAHNALHPDVYAAGIAEFDRIRRDAGVRAVVIAGDGANFCAGGNLNRLLENRGKDPSVQMASIEKMHAWVLAIRDCDCPVIAAVEGAAAGAGFSLALACDMLVAAEDAKFVMAYVRVGLSPDGGATQWLGTRLPYQTAFELLCTGEAIGAQRLHALGVVNRVVATGTAVSHAVAMAEKLAAGPAGALARIKRLLDGAAAPHPLGQLERERDALVECLFHADGEEGIRAFLEKRKPRFSAARALEPGSKA